MIEVVSTFPTPPSAVAENIGDNLSPQSVGLPAVWYLAYTKPRQEAIAHLNLQQQGFDAYLPLYKRFKRGENEAVLEPMFPRYIMLRPQRSNQAIGVVRSTRGVMTLVRFGFELACLPDRLVNDIRAIEQARNNASLAEMTPFMAGQSVRLVSGPFEGLEGLVQATSSKRVVVLLELLGRSARVQVARQQLASV